MAEIDVSLLFGEDCGMLSASQFELGEHVGKITWTNCLKLADRAPLVTDENRDDIRDHFAGYGAWEREEIDAWTDLELSALVWQDAAASMREFEDHCNSDLATYERECERGSISGRLHIANSNEAFFYIGT